MWRWNDKGGCNDGNVIGDCGTSGCDGNGDRSHDNIGGDEEATLESNDG